MSYCRLKKDFTYFIFGRIFFSLDLFCYGWYRLPKLGTNKINYLNQWPMLCIQGISFCLSCSGILVSQRRTVTRISWVKLSGASRAIRVQSWKWQMIFLKLIVLKLIEAIILEYRTTSRNYQRYFFGL